MSEDKIYNVPAEFAAKTNITAEQYKTLYKQSIDDPETFWGEQAKEFLSWSKPWDKVMDYSFDANDLYYYCRVGLQLFGRRPARRSRSLLTCTLIHPRR